MRRRFGGRFGHSIRGRLPRRGFNGAQLRIWEAEAARPEPRCEAAEAGAGAAAGTVLAASHDGIDVACGRGVLRILRLQLAGRKPLVGAGIPQGTAARRRALRAGMKTAAASARSLAAHAVARILREGVTLDAALKDALAAADPKLAPSVRSLSYGAVRGYYRHEAILGRLLSHAGEVPGFSGARAAVGRAVRTRG